MALLTAKTITKLRLLSNQSSINKFTLQLIKKSDLDAQQRCTSTTSSKKGGSLSIAELNQTGLPTKAKLDLSFEDSETAFKAKSNSDLLRGYLVFKLCGINYLIENQKMVKLIFKLFIFFRYFKVLCIESCLIYQEKCWVKSCLAL